MTTSEFLNAKINEYNLNKFVQDSNLEYNWIKFKPITNSIIAERFVKFIVECDVISIEPRDGFLMCRFL